MKSFTMNVPGFSKVLKQYAAATKKELPDVLNRALRNVGFRAAQFTPKDSPAEIEADLLKDKFALKFITSKLRARIGKQFTTKKGKTRTVQRVTRKQIALATRQFIKRRKRRTGFLRAGWVAALISAGLKTSGLSGNLLADSKSKNAIGSGVLATVNTLRASLSNGVWSRLGGKSKARTAVAMQQALQRAMAFVAKDMDTFAKDKLGKVAKQYSAK